VTKVMKFQDPQDAGYSLPGCATVSSSRTVLYGIIYSVGKITIKSITDCVYVNLCEWDVITVL